MPRSKIKSKAHYVSVTEGLGVIRTSLDDFLDSSGERARFTIMEKGMYGKQVHKLCEIYIRCQIDGTEVPELPEDVFPDAIMAYHGFVKWAEKNVKRFLDCECEVYHDGYKYVGHFDFTCIMKGDTGISVVDIKTPVTASDVWYLQIEGYRRAYESMPGKNRKTARGFALMVLSDKPPKVKESDAGRNRLFSLFVCALNIYHYMKGD